MESLLTKQSEDFFAKGTAIESLDERLDRVFLTETTLLSEDHRQELAEWANSEFGSELTAEDLRGLDRDYTRIHLNDAYQAKYRPELRQAERSLILEVIDTAWKEHLYFMDHLRSGIGLVGYAQKDPKVEYKREGRKAFQNVWNRVDSQVSAAIFRMDRQSPDFVGSLWRITNVEHEDPQQASQKEYREESGDVNRGLPTMPWILSKTRGQKLVEMIPVPVAAAKNIRSATAQALPEWTCDKSHSSWRTSHTVFIADKYDLSAADRSRFTNHRLSHDCAGKISTRMVS
jgi:preprotein translocase subunit SecA